MNKLTEELPFLGSIQFYAWGEPFLNRDLGKIVKIPKEAGVLTALSSNINAPHGYEEVIKAGLDWFKISTSGFGESYELTHTGGKWETFYKNLHHIAELRDLHNPSMQIVVNYHLYSHNNGEDYIKMEKLCGSLNLIFRPSPAYIYPLDTVSDYVDGKELSPEAEKARQLLLMGLDEGIEKALTLKDNPCPEERCLPISWDGKVRFCGVYFKPYIADSFLETTVGAIIHKRTTSKFCEVCKSKGLHQFTGVYLAEKRLYEGGFE